MEFDENNIQENKIQSKAAEDELDLKDAKKIASLCYHALDEKQGIDIQILDIHRISILADYLVIANGKNPNHVRALMDAVEDKCAEAGYEANGREGINSYSWALLDFNHVIVHIFSEEARKFYNLERLWQDGIKTGVEELEA